MSGRESQDARAARTAVDAPAEGDTSAAVYRVRAALRLTAVGDHMHTLARVRVSTDDVAALLDDLDAQRARADAAEQECVRLRAVIDGTNAMLDATVEARDLADRLRDRLRDDLDAATHALDDARARLDAVADALGLPAEWDGEWGDRVRGLRTVVDAVRVEHVARAAWLASLPPCAGAPADLIAAETATGAALDGVASVSAGLRSAHDRIVQAAADRTGALASVTPECVRAYLAAHGWTCAQVVGPWAIYRLVDVDVGARVPLRHDWIDYPRLLWEVAEACGAAEARAPTFLLAAWLGVADEGATS